MMYNEAEHEDQQKAANKLHEGAIYLSEGKITAANAGVLVKVSNFSAKQVVKLRTVTTIQRY